MAHSIPPPCIIYGLKFMVYKITAHKTVDHIIWLMDSSARLRDIVATFLRMTLDLAFLNWPQRLLLIISTTRIRIYEWATFRRIIDSISNES